ncbi:isocitrate/isopropylmalate dehydrogenase family protein [Rhodococcus sp. 1R11]|uniref:isocitrate/isopropylmalate dehydrogenase family protein n=1 Tax=Rhodococcus sp. 1R11 TaxID=2559614 RepID=UPI0010718624|nr:isocitrate/isopropylmalate dehydrogenase family protein [Rhodococcus sp. 1R11]TFI43110.1 isocitrate/isopropylmalate dehydrogenase family protein [Rhodococcus sp. 1R11]
MTSRYSSPDRRTTVDLIVLAGDGIGPEISAATVSVIESALNRSGMSATFTHGTIGFAALEASGTTMPDAIVDLARAADGVILGPVSHLDYPPATEGGVNPSGVLRRKLDLYANIRPARTVDALPNPLGKKFDLVIARENTEGFYADRTMYAGGGEFMPTEDLALAVRKVTRHGSERIVRRAFDLASNRSSKVTVVHKANVLRLSDGLFLEAARAVRQDFPAVEYEELLVDAVAALLIRRPESFDVIATTNMFGDILSDEATELSGSLGLAASLNLGDDHAVAQAQHGSAPDIAGRGIANPASLIGSAAMLLSWLGDRREDDRLRAAAHSIHRAIDRAVSVPETRTADLHGSATTERFTLAVIDQLALEG